jgi:hypothetical protein
MPAIAAGTDRLKALTEAYNQLRKDGTLQGETPARQEPGTTGNPLKLQSNAKPGDLKLNKFYIMPEGTAYAGQKLLWNGTGFETPSRQNIDDDD